MSSIPHKKEAFLLRSASLQKIRCSANRLQGSIFSKDSSIIHHLKSTYSTSCSTLQKPFVSSILSVAMAVWAQLIVRCGKNPIFEKSSEFISGINHLVSKHQSDFEIKTATVQLFAALSSTRVLLFLASHICMLMIYLQLGLLVYLVSLTQLKVGFIFLLACIIVIHVLVSEICFMNKTVVKSTTMRKSRRAHYENSRLPIQRLHSDEAKDKNL